MKLLDCSRYLGLVSETFVRHSCVSWTVNAAHSGRNLELRGLAGPLDLGRSDGAGLDRFASKLGDNRSGSFICEQGLAVSDLVIACSDLTATCSMPSEAASVSAGVGFDPLSPEFG